MTTRPPRPFGEVVDELATELLAQQDPQGVLDRAVRFALQGVPGADGVSVSLVGRRRHLSTAAAAGGLARLGDALQQQVGEGPCLDAAEDGALAHSPDLGEDGRWPQWAPQATAQLGVRSIVSAPLSPSGRTVGSVNFYARATGAFGPSDVSLARSIATQTAVAHTRAVDHQGFRAALATRNLIGQAQGILMERHKITAERAFEVLATTSQETNTKLVEIARRVLETGTSPPAAGR